MSQQPIELLAAYFTLAGDVYPFGPTEISPFSLQARAEAASKAGWVGMGFAHADVMANVERLGLPTMRQILGDNGMKYVELEFLVDWYLDGDRRKASDKERQNLLTVASALKVRSLKIAGGIHDPAPADVPRMRDAFAILCQDFAKVGTNIVLELMPFSNVKTIDTALGIVQGANQPNGGLLLDNWHISRGGIPYKDLARIPAQFIKAIELDDADKEVVGTLFEDTIYKRKLCGEGFFNPPEFIKAVQSAGFKGAYGVEILSETYRKLPLEVMAQRSFDTTMAQFKKIAG
jgi:sugar phosphate isomerase/epimerase